MFEKASRLKLRFPYKGQATTEDLWDLPLADLDKIYKSLKAQQKQHQEESLLATKSKEDDVLSLQIAIVTHVFETKKAEQAQREQAQTKAAEKQKIMELIVAKKDEHLRSLPVEELTKMLEAL